MTVFDLAKQSEAWSKIFFQKAFGLGLFKIGKADQVSEVDMPLRTYADAIADVQDADKFRKPEEP